VNSGQSFLDDLFVLGRLCRIVWYFEGGLQMTPEVVLAGTSPLSWNTLIL